MLPLICVLFFVSIASCYNVGVNYYKISMVSSDESPGKPALFVHGRSAVWDGDHQCLYFVDVTEQNVHRLDYVSGKIYTQHIDYGGVHVVSLVSGSKRLLVAVRAALYLLDWGAAGDGALRQLTALDLGRPDNGVAVGGVDNTGRYWVATKGAQRGDRVAPDRGSLYSVEQGALSRPSVQLKPVTSLGGIAWALNHSLVYLTDSANQIIEAYDFDPKRGEISGRRTLIDITVYGYEDAYPEGLAVDTRGGLWVAITGAGTVLHIDPDRRHVLFGYKLPVSRVTSLAWGGPQLDELFVTSARDTLHEGIEPYAGAIFTIRFTGSSGWPANRFALDNADTF